VQCDNYCIPICKDKHPRTRPVQFVNIGNDRYKSNFLKK
jgi:hypothetical protein